MSEAEKKKEGGERGREEERRMGRAGREQEGKGDMKEGTEKERKVGVGGRKRGWEGGGEGGGRGGRKERMIGQRIQVRGGTGKEQYCITCFGRQRK